MQRGEQVRKGRATPIQEPGTANPGPEAEFRSQHPHLCSTERTQDRSWSLGCSHPTAEDEAIAPQTIRSTMAGLKINVILWSRDSAVDWEVDRSGRPPQIQELTGLLGQEWTPAKCDLGPWLQQRTHRASLRFVKVSRE